MKNNEYLISLALTCIKYISVGLIAFFSPIKYAFIFTFILVFVDTVTGVMNAGKDDVKNISSSKGFRIIPKLIFYSLLIIVAHSLNLHIDNQIPFVKLSLIGIGWIEIKSIDENFRDIFGFSFIDKVLEATKKLKEIKRYKD